MVELIITSVCGMHISHGTALLEIACFSQEMYNYIIAWDMCELFMSSLIRVVASHNLQFTAYQTIFIVSEITYI